MTRPYSQNGSSLAQRVATQFEQEFGRPANANDPAFVRWSSEAMARLQKADADALARSQRNMNRVKNAAMVAAAVPYVAAALPAIAGGGAVTGGGVTGAGATGAGAVLPSTSLIPGALAPYAATVPMVAPGAAGALAAGGAPLFGPGAANTGVWSAGAGAAPPVFRGGGNNTGINGGGGLFRASDLVRYGIPAATSLLTGYMGNRAGSQASTAALDAQQRQFDATQAWLREQEANNERRHREIEDEKRRQFDAVESEKRRKWDYGEPWRDASRQSLTRMSDLIERGPQRVAYQPTFQYRP